MRYLLAILLILAFTPAQAESINWEYHPKWRQVVERTAVDRSWMPVLAGITDPAEINRRVNRLSYVLEPVDHWLDPAAFFRAGEGDCEDYAIAKYFALRAIGIDDGRLQLLFGKTSAGGHAVLLFDGRLLDSRTDEILPVKDHPDFRPVYGINATELHIWIGRHGL